jgi:hypothetical protein
MIVCKDWGKHIRLGNWLFVYASLLAIAKRTGHKIHLPDYHMWPYLKHPPLMDSGVQPDEPIFHFRMNTWSREEQDWLYDYFLKRKDIININLGPNCQSEKWFLDELDYVKERLCFTPAAICDVLKKYKHIFGPRLSAILTDKPEKPLIGIGIRRGDFVGHGVFYQIPLDWYLRALGTNFPNWRDCNILFFSDNIEEVKTIFRGDNFFFAEPNGTHTHAENFKYYHQNPMEQFILGTLCDHFIGGNSTFSWWQMWYVKNFNGGKVVHCGKNLSDAGEREFGKNNDYYPTDWTLYNI